MHNIQDNLQHEDLTTLEIAGVGAGTTLTTEIIAVGV